MNTTESLYNFRGPSEMNTTYFASDFFQNMPKIKGGRQIYIKLKANIYY